MLGYQNSLAGLRQQLEKQLQELNLLEQQAVRQQPVGIDPYMQGVVRQEIERYMSERQQTVLPQPNNPMTEIVGGIEAVLSEADVKFLAENIGVLPDFLRSSEGKKLLEKLVAEMKKQGEKTVDTQTGNTT